MSDLNIDQVAPGGKVNLSDAPAGLDDATFDSLFPAEPAPVAIAPSQEPAPAPIAAPQIDQPVQPGQPYLKGNSSVYNSPEAAVEGINQKDALIENLRQRYALTTGVDPITGQPIGQQVPKEQPLDYYNSPDKYMDDLYAAAKTGGPNAYRDVQAKFLMDTLKPMQPMMQRIAREQAVQAASQDIKEVGGYIGTQQYNQALDSVPELKQAIQTSESDYRFHDRLPGLYKIAYLTGQGQQLPAILKAQAATQTQNSPAPPRPTMQPSTPALPTQSAVKPTFKNAAGIKAYIAEAEAKGAKLDF